MSTKKMNTKNMKNVNEYIDDYNNAKEGFENMNYEQKERYELLYHTKQIHKLLYLFIDEIIMNKDGKNRIK